MNDTEKQFWDTVFLKALDHAHGGAVAAVHANREPTPPFDVKSAADAADEALKRRRAAEGAAK